MAPTAYRGVNRGKIFSGRGWPARLTDRLGEGDQVVDVVRRRIEFALVPNEIPATRRGQAAGVLLAEIVRMRLGECGERSDDGGGVCVDIRQRRHSQPGAAVARAAPWRPHRRTVSPAGAGRPLRHAANRPRPVRGEAPATTGVRLST
jgi:hypothetical protein